MNSLTVIVRRFQVWTFWCIHAQDPFCATKDQALIALHHVPIFLDFPPFRAAVGGPLVWVMTGMVWVSMVMVYRPWCRSL